MLNNISLGYSVIRVYHGKNGELCRAGCEHTFPDVMSARVKAKSWRKALNENWDVYVVEVTMQMKEKII